MKNDKRLHREPASRKDPDRASSKMFNQGKHSSSDKEGGQPGKPSWSNTVGHGVNLGYRVIEEQIRQGQRVAQQFNDRSYGLGSMGSDLQESMERIVKYYSELMSLSVELVGSVARNGYSGPGSAGAQARSTGDASGRNNLKISVKVTSSAPTLATLNLDTDRGDPAVSELRMADSKQLPLTQVAFSRADDGHVVVHIEVPDKQPPGTYNGVVYDKQSSRPMGTLSVCVEQSPAAAGAQDTQ